MWRVYKKYHHRSHILGRFQNMMKRRPSCYLYFSVIVLILYCLVVLIGRFILPIHIDITHRSILEQHKCPACFGENLCSDIYHGNIKLTSWTRYTISKLLNARNVYYGELYGNKNFPKIKIIGKKLGHDIESEMLDGAICKMSEKSPYYCNPAHYVKFLTELYTKEKNTETVDQEYGRPNAR